MANNVLTDAFLAAQEGDSTHFAPIDFDGDDAIYVLLVDAAGTAETDATKQGHVFRGDITHEATGTAYTAGGQQVTAETLTTSGHVVTWTGGAITWTGATVTASGCWFYKHTGSGAAADPLIGYWDFGGSFASSAGPFTITPNAAGILAKQHA